MFTEDAFRNKLFQIAKQHYPNTVAIAFCYFNKNSCAIGVFCDDIGEQIVWFDSDFTKVIFSDPAEVNAGLQMADRTNQNIINL